MNYLIPNMKKKNYNNVPVKWQAKNNKVGDFSTANCYVQKKLLTKSTKNKIFKNELQQLTEIFVLTSLNNKM